MISSYYAFTSWHFILFSLCFFLGKQFLVLKTGTCQYSPKSLQINPCIHPPMFSTRRFRIRKSPSSADIIVNNRNDQQQKLWRSDVIYDVRGSMWSCIGVSFDHSSRWREKLVLKLFSQHAFYNPRRVTCARSSFAHPGLHTSFLRLMQLLD